MTKQNQDILNRLQKGNGSFTTTSDRIAKVAKKMGGVYHVYSIHLGWKPDGETPVYQYRFTRLVTANQVN